MHSHNKDAIASAGVLDRVLALSMRPQTLSELVGQENVVETLKAQIDSGRLPHCFLIAGSPGRGKTTLARILSTEMLGPAQVVEINAANKTGVDDVRQLVQTMRYLPMYPNKARVAIIDEAHQLSNAAQNALITETEDVADHVYYIFCTSNENNIVPALKRRAYIIIPDPLTKPSLNALLLQARERTGNTDFDMEPLATQLLEYGITAPGLVLQAAELYFSGWSAERSVVLSEMEKSNALAFCQALAAGQWTKCSAFLKKITKSDVVGLKVSAMGYLNKVLLNATGARAYNVSKALQHLGNAPSDDLAALPCFNASVCLACEFLKSPVTKPAKAK